MSPSPAARPQPLGLGGRNPRLARGSGLKLSASGSNSSAKPTPAPFSAFSKYVDPSGALQFAGKAVLHASGADFTGGSSYKINMAELELREELGRGQYGTVQRVYHKPTRVTMAMKEIRLELDESKLRQILMELDVLHRSHSPYIVDFYGAFCAESCVFYCMEYMDAGSLDKLYGYQGGAPEPILADVAFSVVSGLQFLKHELKVIHRDVKPTNILANSRGQIKLCDFGVSGQLVQSLAKTNVGCQSYMAPERIAMASNAAYSAASDVWSVGVSILECGRGAYPYPADKFDSVFAQLNAIVAGEPPEMPRDKFSKDAAEWVKLCMQKDPRARPTYPQLLEHPWLREHAKVRDTVDVAGWVAKSLAWRAAVKQKEQASAGQKSADNAPGVAGGVGVPGVAEENAATAAGAGATANGGSTASASSGDKRADSPTLAAAVAEAALGAAAEVAQTAARAILPTSVCELVFGAPAPSTAVGTSLCGSAAGNVAVSSASDGDAAASAGGSPPVTVAGEARTGVMGGAEAGAPVAG